MSGLDAASKFNASHFTIGFILVISSALLGGSIGDVVFGTSTTSSRLATAGLGIIGTLFAGLQTFLNAESRSKDHHDAREIRRRAARTGTGDVDATGSPLLDDSCPNWSRSARGSRGFIT